MGPLVLMFQSDWHNSAFQKLLYSVQSGEVPFELAFGKSWFEWFKENSDQAEIFHRANSIKAVESHSVICSTYDFSFLASITDVGGGYGELIFHILKNILK